MASVFAGFCVEIFAVLVEFNSQPYLNVKSNSLIGLLNSMWGFWNAFQIEDKVSLIFQVCSHEGNCPRSEKCCFDKCLNHHTCKPALRTPPRNLRTRRRAGLPCGGFALCPPKKWAWNPSHTKFLHYFFVIEDYFFVGLWFCNSLATKASSFHLYLLTNDIKVLSYKLLFSYGKQFCWEININIYDSVHFNYPTILLQKLENQRFVVKKFVSDSHRR